MKTERIVFYRCKRRLSLFKCAKTHSLPLENKCNEGMSRPYPFSMPGALMKLVWLEVSSSPSSIRMACGLDSHFYSLLVRAVTLMRHFSPRNPFL